jgi:2,5-diketo-D-gluconate reductase A
MPMAMLKLNDGNKIPNLGLGIWQIPAESTAATVSGAIGLGYRLIDGAAIYGNEAGLGDGVRAADVPRDQMFITTKIWNDRQGHDETLRAFDDSVDRLGLTPDLLLIHWPCPDKGLYVDTWRALIRLRDEGRVKSIGVSNFGADHLERIIDDTGVTPVLNQIELHPQFSQATLRSLHDRLGIVTQSWTPLGKGGVFDAAPVVQAADRTGKTPTQVVLRWHVQLGLSAIPRSTNPDHQAQNHDVFDFALNDDEMSAIATLDDGARLGPDPTTFC